MGSYEGLRQIRSSATVYTIMTPQMFQGNFSQTATVVKDPANNNTPFPGNIIPTARLSGPALKLQQYYPTPNGNGLTQNFGTSIANNNNTDQTVDRIDQNLGDKIRTFFRYQRQQESLVAGASNVTQNTYSNVYISNFAIGYTHTLTANLVNDARFGRNYLDTASLNYFAVNNLANAGSQLGIP